MTNHPHTSPDTTRPGTTPSVGSVGSGVGHVVDERSDNELLAAYAAGDNEAFGEFVRRYEHFMVAVAARRIGTGVGAASWHDAQDAAAEAWITIMGQVGALGPDGVGEVKNWLASFARNTAIRITSGYAQRRTPARDPHVLGEAIAAHGYRLPGASGPAEPESDHDRQTREDAEDMLGERFAQALAGLTTLQRGVMSRRLHRRELTARQIAEELGTTLGSVKSAERSGRRALRRALGDLVGEPAPTPVDPLQGQTLSPRRSLLIEHLRNNPAMTGPQAKTVLEQAGLGPISSRAARKVLTKARTSLTTHTDTDTDTNPGGVGEGGHR